MNKLIFAIISMMWATSSFSQKFSDYSFEISPSKGLKKIVDQYDEKNNKVVAYEYIDQSNGFVSAYRVIVLKFKTTITDLTTYFNSLVTDYKKMGATAYLTTNNGEKAVSVTEKVTIEGRTLDQRTLVLFHNNSSYSIVLTSNATSNSSLFTTYISTFKFLD